jgi:hypothetical protein
MTPVPPLLPASRSMPCLSVAPGLRPIECLNLASAAVMLKRLSGGLAHCLHVCASPRTQSFFSPSAGAYTHTSAHVGIGVYYPHTSTNEHGKQLAPHLDFWGFACGRAVQLACGASDTVTVRRAWCAPSASEPQAHSSYDMYRSWRSDLGSSGATLDYLEQCIRSRASLYEHVRDPLSHDSAIRPCDRAMLAMQTAADVERDAASYHMVLMFVMSNAYALANAADHAVMVGAWRKAEYELSVYRLSHHMASGLEHYLAASLGGPVECRTSDDVIMTELVARSRRGAMSDDEKEDFVDSLRGVLPEGERVYQMPFELCLAAVRDRAYMQRGMVWARVCHVHGALAQSMRDSHARNQAEVRELSRSQQLSGLFGDERIRAMHAKFARQFSIWSRMYMGLGAAHSAMANLTPLELSKQREHVRMVMTSSASCMTQLLLRAVSVRTPAHNKLADRSTVSKYLLRMRVPMELVKPQIRAKIEASYGSSARSEVRTLEKSMDFETIRHAATPAGSLFVPRCWYIINGSRKGAPSGIACPHAVAAHARSPTELYAAAKTACNAEWAGHAGPGGAGVERPGGPDEFATRLIIAKKKTAAMGLLARAAPALA